MGPGTWRDRYVHPCVWEQAFAPLAVTEMFAASVARHHDRVLADCLGREFTYRAIDAEARRFAAGLQALGIGKGDRIGLYLPNLPVYLSAYFGAMMAGAIIVNFSPLHPLEQLRAQIEDSGTRLLVTADVPALLPKAERALRSTGLEWLAVVRLSTQLPFWQGLGLRLFRHRETVALPHAPDIVEWTALLEDREPDPVAIDPLADIALLQYTGGVTGAPGGAMLTHQNLTANARQIEAIDPHAHVRDVILGVLPFFHVFANACVLNRTICAGGMVAMLPRFQAGRTLATLQRVRATTLPGVPAMFRALLDHPDIERTDFTSLFTCISGGAPLPAPLKQGFERKTGAKLVEAYGLTEAAGMVASNPFDGREQAGSVGHPLPATDLRLLDANDPGRDAAPGEAGELAVTGPQVMQGYWNRPEAAARAFVERDGARWLRTGDIATIDEDGYVRIVGRDRDAIVVGGARVYPGPVEKVLTGHPAVREAVVIGMPDPGRGERPWAYVVLDPAGGRPDPVAIAGWANARLGEREQLAKVVPCGALPRTLIGQPDRRAMRATAGAG